MATVTDVANEAQLRAAIFQASNDFAIGGNGPYTINITANIILSQSLPMLRGGNAGTAVTFNGGGHTIDANNAGRVFFVASGAVAINNLTIANARAEGGDGGQGMLTGAGGGGGGGLGAGAAVFVNSGAIVTLTNVTAHNALSKGGDGGAAGGAAGNSGGGGGGGLGGDGGNGGNDAGGGGGGYEGAGGQGSFAGAGGGGEFGAGGAGSIAGGGGGGGQSGAGGPGGSSIGGGEGGGAIGLGQAGGVSGGAGGSEEGGNGGTSGTDGGNGGALGGGGGGGAGAFPSDGGSGGSSGGGGGGGLGITAGGNGGLGGGGGGGGLLAGGNGGDFGGGGGTANGIDQPGGAGGFGGGGGGGGGGLPSSGGFGGGDGGSAGGGGAGDGLGGAVFVRSGGSLIINNGTFTGTFGVSAGTPGSGGAAGSAQGSIFFLHGAGTTTLGVSSGQSRTIGGTDAIAGTGSLTKAGAGTLIFSGSNSYTGTTRVNDGLLRVDGSIVSATVVKEGATLGGSGTTRAVNVEAGGTLAPGASASILHTRSIALASGATLEVEVGGTSAGAGGYDRVAVNGTVSLAGAILDGTMLGGFVPKLGDRFTIIDNDGSDAIVGTFAGRPEGAKFLFGGRVLTITYHGGDGNDVVLTDAAGTVIIGTKHADKINGTQSAPMQPLATDKADTISGLGAKDKIKGLGGDDLLSGGKGKDTLTGGTGFDALVFDVKLKGANVDHITDFTPGVDQLQLDHDIFKKLKVGDLPKKAFFAGKKVDEGKDDKDRVVYDKQSGKFWYDADGPGGKDAKLVAILDGSPNGLTHEDIVVIA